MKYSKLNCEQQFDTLRLHIPLSAVNNPKLSNFKYNLAFNAETHSVFTEDVNVYALNTKHKGVKCDFVPSREIFDTTISAKILREDYYKGISKDTIQKVADNLADAGICDSIDTSDLILNSKVLRADNTFNIEMDEDDIQSYYDSLELVVSQGKRGKIDIFDNDFGQVNGIIVGKNTNKVQKITIYNKLDEARALTKKKYAGQKFEQAVENEYGMKYADFNDYFYNRLRLELRVADYDKLRKLYTKKNKGEVNLNDLLFSENNAILYQWTQFVNKKQTNTAINFLDMSLSDKRNYKLQSYSAAANWALLKEFVEMFKGSEQLVKEKIQKLYYTDPAGNTYKKISPSVQKDITRFCSEYRQNNHKAKKGTLFTSDLTKHYKELDEKINNL